MKITVLSKQAVKRYKPAEVSALIAINDLDEIDHKRNYVSRFRYKQCFFHFFDDTLEDEPYHLSPIQSVGIAFTGASNKR